MKIGILQTGHTPQELTPTLGTYSDMFARLLDGNGFMFQTWSVVDGDFPDALTDADGWLITGSKHGAYEDHDWIPPLEQLIRDIYADGRPLIGVCFGHQIIAQAMGGKVVKFDKGWSVGRTNYDMNGTPVSLNAWHQDQVVEVPDTATTIASNDFCENAALVYGDKIWTIQPHPEFESPNIEGLIAYRGKGIVPDHQLDQARDGLPQPNNNQDIAGQMAAFFKRKPA